MVSLKNPKREKIIGTAYALCVSVHSFSLIKIEVDISRGLFQFDVVGLPDKAVQESRFRIFSALRNTGYITPQKNNEKIIVSLIPTNIKKQSVYTDLAITFAYLQATYQVKNPLDPIFQRQICCVGNVSLSGDISTDNTDISHMIYQSYKLGIRYFIVPKDMFKMIKKDIFSEPIHIWSITSISELKKQPVFKVLDTDHHFTSTIQPKTYTIDSLIGLTIQKRALAIALAGDHHILFIGMPGSGKSALAQSAQELLDQLTTIELLESMTINHLSGNMRSGTYTSADSAEKVLQKIRPVESPHFKSTQYQMTGNRLFPFGAIQRSYYGLLILDELAEYQRNTIETLRHRMDPIFNTISGIVIATSNTCPCGKKQLDKKIKNNTCTCTPAQIKNYLSKISEPVLDRFHIIQYVAYRDRYLEESEENQTGLKKYSGHSLYMQINSARNLQRKRNRDRYNANLTIQEVKLLGITEEGQSTLNKLGDQFLLSKRTQEHLYQISRTIADLDSKTMIETRHIYEALQYVKQKLD